MTSTIRSVPFLRLWLGNTASAVATWGLPFTLGFAVSVGTISSAALGILLALRSVGFLLGVPVGGVLADRAGRRRVLVIASLIAAAGALLTCPHIEERTPLAFALVLAGVALSGFGEGACRPVYQAIVPAIVSRNDFQPANAALSLSTRVTYLIGPAATVLIATTIGLQAAFFAISALWIVSAFLPPWPVEAKKTALRRALKICSGYRFVTDLFEGFREARRHPWFFSALAALSTVIATGYSVNNVLTPQLSQVVFGDASLLAGTAMSYACGALAGAIILSNWNSAKRGWWALTGLGVYGVVPFSLLYCETYWIPIAAYLLAGFGAELFNIVWFTAIQQEIAEEKLATVSSLDFIISYGLAPLGLCAVAPLSEWIGVPSVLVATSIICVTAAFVACAAPTSSEFRVSR